jgi:signal transduction histidine kinase
MFQFYEQIPFGVLVLNGLSLKVEFVNSRLTDMLHVDSKILNRNYTETWLKTLITEIEECFKDKKEVQVYEQELIQGRFFNITVCCRGTYIDIYIQDNTTYVEDKRKIAEDSQEKLLSSKEKFLNISTELKTKCDIIEILREREKEHLMHLRDVINNISEGIVVINNKGQFSLCNRAAYNITELNMGQLIQGSEVLKKYAIHNLDNEDEDVAYLYGEVYKKNKPIRNIVFKFVDKITYKIKYIEISSNPIFNREQKLVYTIITLKDVTEAKIHQLHAEEQADFIKDIVNNLDVPITVIDYPDLTYKLVNKKYQNLFSLMSKNATDNFIGDKIRHNLKGGIYKEFYSIVSAVGRNGKEFTMSPITVKDENGERRFYKIKFKPYKDNEGKVKKIHVHGLDITDEINHTTELEKVTRLKDEFFTVISHELRTPLTIIYSSLQLANDIYKEEITPNLSKTLGRIGQNCSRLLKLINNILDISKAEAGFLSLNCSYFDIVYVSEHILSSVNLYARSKGIQLIFDTNEEECLVYMDKDKYEKIFLNLLSNAIKFTSEGKQVYAVLEISEGSVTLSVRDEGIGIPKNKVNYIFDRFAQVNSSLSRRAEGTGIGLSLVKKLVELMEGNIAVKSKEGRGSEFLVEFKKECIASENSYTAATIDSGISDKVNIEFSDIN